MANKGRGKHRMPFATRLKAAMLAAGLDTKSVAKKLEVTPQVVRRWLRQKEPQMSAKNLVRLGVVLNVRAHWLATGEGPASRFNSSSYTEAEMIEAFHALSPAERRLLRDIVGIILKHRDD